MSDLYYYFLNLFSIFVIFATHPRIISALFAFVPFILPRS